MEDFTRQQKNRYFFQFYEIEFQRKHNLNSVNSKQTDFYQ